MVTTEESGGHQVTEDIVKWKEGDPAARDRVIDAIAEELKSLARAKMLREQRGHTLQPTELVNEAYLALQGHEGSFDSRAHLLAWIARQMTRLLIDHARKKRAAKRGAGVEPRTLVESLSGERARNLSAEVLLDLEVALDELEQRHRGTEMRQLVELYFFGGLEWTDVAEVMDVSESTVMRRWKVTKRTLREIMLARESDGDARSGDSNV